MSYSFVLLPVMSRKVAICLLLICVQTSITTSETDPDDVTGLLSLKAIWENVPPSWNGFRDPCGDRWEGIACNNTRVISITLSSIGLKGVLSGDIRQLSELQTLDLSSNKGLTGSLPEAIGNLAKLTNLILVGCNFIGKIPDSIGSLSNLIFLSLNSNSLSGSIPSSIGNLSKLYWLDLAENKLTGTLPVSNGTKPGLDMLHSCKHFHFGRNQLSGSIPPQLLHENMTLIHLLLDNNKFEGSIPSTIGLVNEMEVLRLDWNSFSGSVPSNISNLTEVTEMLLSNNQFTGSMPDLTGMNQLSYLDMSNNSFDTSDVPSWFTALPSLTTLIMEKTQLQGEVPESLFSLPQLQKVVLKRNKLSGTLNIGSAVSSQLRSVDMQNNNISAYTKRPEDSNVKVILVGNPYCSDAISGERYCILPQQSNISYTTPPQNCAPSNCDSDKISSPSCHCAYPYTGTLVFRAPQFSDLENFTHYKDLEIKLSKTFKSKEVPVDSVSLSNVSRGLSNYLEMTLQVFPLDQDRFNRTAISTLGFMLTNQTFKPPPDYGPFYFTANGYTTFAEESAPKLKKILSMAAIIGIAAGGAALLIALCVVAIICFRMKRPPKTVERDNRLGLPSTSSWMSAGSTSSTLPLAGSRVFPLEEIKKMTNNFSESNVIGSGTYGKVYRGTLTNGQLVAVKRAKQGSPQGDLEFKTEIELLSRVHHKNLVKLFGFCLEKGELILVYEYVPNGTLKESLSGKSGIRLDWRRRIKVGLGAARGLAYLHELASPPIIHRDVKSNNLLLDEHLNAKVSDFGLSKTLLDVGKGHISTEVKGTMGYLDPEYYMTQKLNEKSDVYSFGVLMLELITGKSPIDRGRYIVREVRNAIDRAEDLYGLHEFLDPGIGLGTSLKGFEKYVNLALCCVEESGVDRPVMGNVVKQLEDILQMAGLNPYTDSASSSGAYGDGNSRHLYGDESLYGYSGQLPR
ncbi:probable leucine-rich repeat receptor-like protein kinase At5g49770 [Chenopodium quinoa]|uniref:probable leucine-rich repeat receptor-like protein kinase At5g49770 n=1 Tax=Chenopodium quinoa TaxID=63459 RepID=UPI000B772B58|nr:probable leucine-rich repeat receptor-like protein kinase At5g49770 [Chenopodium quinoa]